MRVDEVIQIRSNAPRPNIAQQGAAESHRHGGLTDAVVTHVIAPVLGAVGVDPRTGTLDHPQPPIADRPIRIGAGTRPIGIGLEALLSLGLPGRVDQEPGVCVPADAAPDRLLLSVSRQSGGGAVGRPDRGRQHKRRDCEIWTRPRDDPIPDRAPGIGWAEPSGDRLAEFGRRDQNRPIGTLKQDRRGLLRQPIDGVVKACHTGQHDVGRRCGDSHIAAAVERQDSQPLKPRGKRIRGDHPALPPRLAHGAQLDPWKPRRKLDVEAHPA